ncbi:hypothetical protein D910_12476 [Dendroctonus ponderosae]
MMSVRVGLASCTYMESRAGSAGYTKKEEVTALNPDWKRILRQTACAPKVAVVEPVLVEKHGRSLPPTASSALIMSTAVVDKTSGRNSHGPRLQSSKNIS